MTLALSAIVVNYRSAALAQRCVVGGGHARRLCFAMRPYDELARKALRRLGSPEMLALDRSNDPARRLDLLQGVDDR